MPHQHASSADPFEATYGYARAIRAGAHIYVSGTTAREPELAGDAYTQAKGALATIAAALDQLGASLAATVRTVVYVTDMADAPQIAQAHNEAFATIRPASTLVQVAALTPAAARVEIELTAIAD